MLYDHLCSASPNFFFLSILGSKNPGNVAGGLKATLHNDRVSDEAKQSAQERLERMGGPNQGSTYLPVIFYMLL